MKGKRGDIVGAPGESGPQGASVTVAQSAAAGGMAAGFTGALPIAQQSEMLSGMHPTKDKAYTRPVCCKTLLKLKNSQTSGELDHAHGSEDNIPKM